MDNAIKKESTKKILHITPHMGGGVGKAICGILSHEVNNKDITHKLIILEKPEDTQYIDICRLNNVNFKFINEYQEIAEYISQSDIVIIHWWHHPLIAQLLAVFPKQKTRLILWCHVNGATYPMLPFELANEANFAFFTSKYTTENPCWTQKQKEIMKTKSEVVYGLGELDFIEKKYNKQNTCKDFKIGYVGTINFAKLNPLFVEYCAEVLKLIPTAKFVLVGKPENKNEILAQAKKLKIENRFEFLGFQKNINEIYATFDVFGYPLNSWHFGTTENSILEAINAEIPVVLLNQCSEKYLIEDGKTGFLANSKQDYAEKIKRLFDNRELAENLIINAKAMLKNKFSMEKNINNMNKAILKTLATEPKIFNFAKIIGNTPSQWFLACLGEDKILFETNKLNNCKSVFKGINKSSPAQFFRYFPEDKRLQSWTEQLMA